MAQRGQNRHIVLPIQGERAAFPVYSPTGHIVYQRGFPGSGGIWAVPFDAGSLSVTGEPFLVAQDGIYPSVSIDGTLVYHSTASAGLKQLAWVDRNGRVEGTIGQPQDRIGSPALSPDGRWIAVVATVHGISGIWKYGVERGTLIRLTSDPPEFQPSWSPTGDRIAFGSYRSGVTDIFALPAVGSGTAEILVGGPEIESGPDWSQDDRYLVYYLGSSYAGEDLWYIRLSEDRTPIPLLQAPRRQVMPVLSPDGRYVAYHSNESGQWEVYLISFPSGDERVQVSEDGGMSPRWSGQGGELFYVSDNTLMAVTVSTHPELQVGAPQSVFNGEQVGAVLSNIWNWGYDVTEDGQRFVVVQNVAQEEETTPTITVVQNWHAEFEESR